ncbi:multicomponent Na+:H+ antiporter subunit D [Psychrobacter sp. PL15]|uniref:complex I subunit 5 family protein n=1 Tax=Psychrobacter sp. PL15 TaxID=3071719 RepID=UPI002E02AD5D|nr:multicomponent Na+:H+ antiporter subunit D [Psychrobacter sp. PL15]
MNLSALLPCLVVLGSLLPAIIIFKLPEKSVRIRTVLNLAGAISKLVLVGWMLWGVTQGYSYEARWVLLPGIELVLRADPLALFFVTLSACLWLLTTIYAIGYLENEPHRSRFFGFFSLCVTAAIGVAMAGNLLTFLIFYELLTLTTYPLVVHRGTEAARKAGQTYLIYTLSGGSLMLLGTVWLYTLTGNLEFTEGGFLSGLGAEHHTSLIIIFILLMIGLGVKAALVPLHGWLPKAMVAPAPVSALLHAVAVVKAGAFGIVRVVYEVFGIEFAQQLKLLLPLAIWAAVTIIWGSLRALFQSELKKRLAYSTISQVSYIALGTALFGPVGTIGGLVHLVHQGVMKITLFFSAGNYAETLGVYKIRDMNGAGRRMPLTSISFSIAALGMMGAPLTAGAVTKYWLKNGAIAAQMDWVVWVLWTSTALNALYFLPILWRLWLLPAPAQWPSKVTAKNPWPVTPWQLLLPPALTAFAVVAFGILAMYDIGPIVWAQFITDREYFNTEP